MYNHEDYYSQDPSYEEPKASRPVPYTPSTFLAVLNDELRTTFTKVYLVGEVSSFKTSQGKWIFFDIKDAETSINCFMPIWDLRAQIADGMKVVLAGYPKITKWGRFSLTVQNIMPVGKGSIKKAADLLKAKLQKEGLFDPARKRPLPTPLEHLGVISSTEAAGYVDFIKILNARWGGMKLTVAHTQVQGLEAADQIIRALDYLNEHSDVEAIAILRGGGSKDDLAVFNDERLVRAIARSRLPVITGIGHEVDESLADLVADLRASTPSNAAELITPDRREQIAHLHAKTDHLASFLNSEISSALQNIQRVRPVGHLLIDKLSNLERHTKDQLKRAIRQYVVKITTLIDQNRSKQQILEAHNPDKILRQGYAILSGKISPGATLKIETYTNLITTEIKDVQERQ